MSRVKKTIIYLLVSAFLLYYLTGVFGLFLTPENLMRANEKGMHYGPSEILMKHKTPDGHCIMVGKLENGYSIFEMERILGIFWGRSKHIHEDFNEAYDFQNHRVYFSSDTRTLVVMLQNTDVRELDFEGRFERNHITVWEDVVTIPVSKDGMAVLDMSEMLGDTGELNLNAPDPYSLEGRDAEGNVIYTYQSKK